MKHIGPSLYEATCWVYARALGLSWEELPVHVDQVSKNGCVRRYWIQICASVKMMHGDRI